MRANPYNQAPAKKQYANVRVIAKNFNSDYTIICFDEDDDEILHTKARARARQDFGSQLDSEELEFEILEREEVKL